MKILFFFLFLSLTHTIFAGKKPAELTKLSKAWQNSHAAAQNAADALYRSKTMNADKLYHAELKQMKDNFMEAKNLDGANAAEAEIKKLLAQHGKQKFTPSKEGQVQEVFINPELNLFGTTWEFGNKSGRLGWVKFLPAGRVQSEQYPDAVWQWLNPSTILFQYTRDGAGVLFHFAGEDRHLMKGYSSMLGTPRYLRLKSG